MNVAREVLSKITPKPSVFSKSGNNLYETLSVLPEFGVGSRVVMFLYYYYFCTRMSKIKKK